VTNALEIDVNAGNCNAPVVMNPATRRALMLAGTYGAIAAAYIVGSGLLLHEREPANQAIVMLEIFKGLGFVAVTTVLLFLLSRQLFARALEEAVRSSETDHALRQSRDQLAAAQAVGRIGSWEIDLTTNRIQWSDQVYVIFGVDRGSFGHTLTDFMACVHVDDRAALSEAQARARRTLGPFDAEHRIIRPDGEVRYVHERAEFQLGPDGQAVRQIGTVQDITDRKAVELELERRNRQQAAISELGMAALRVDTAATLMDEAMARAARILDVEYTKVLELSATGDRLRLAAGIGWHPGLVGTATVPVDTGSQAGYTLQQNEPVVVDDLRTEQRFSGPKLLTEHAVVSGISTIIVAGGRPWGVLGIHTTHRRRFAAADVDFVQSLANLIGTVVERDLANRAETERNFLRQMAGEAAGLAGWAYDPGSTEVTWSPELRQLYQRPEDYRPSLEAAFDHCVPEQRERIERRFQDCVQRGVPFDEETEVTTGSGRRLWVRMIGRAERDAHGRVVRVHGAVQDLSERKQLESMLHQSQRLEAIGQLTGGIAHDFNNLLTVIIGNAELLIEATAGDARLHAPAVTTRQAAERGAELTRRLLAYARKQPLAPQPTDVADLLTGMDQLLRRSLGERIEIETVRAGGLWRAMVDPAQLESAVLNLCLNARDAMPDGGRLTLETANVRLDDDYAASHHDVSPGHYVMIAVSDTGHGMTPEIAERAIEPFFTTKPAGQGSGLGLSMAYGFVKQSGGHIKLYSEPGEGTTVRLYVPRTSAEPGESEQPAVGSPTRGHGQRVLVVEDDDMVRAFVSRQVEMLGYRVLSAPDATRALELLDTHEDIDLLFTDVVMPGGLDGRQLAAAASARRPELKVLFTSGYTDNAIVHHGRLDPGVVLLNKPYRLAELAAKLHSVIKG
jgi:PAS domain S-box-containing protein